MKIQPQQLSKLARLICDALIREKLIKIQSNDSTITKTIEAVLHTDARQESEIEMAAKKMMDKFRAQVESGEIEYQKMFSMVKKQLMKDKKFIP